MKKNFYLISIFLAGAVGLSFLALLIIKARENLFYAAQIALFSAIPFLLVSLLRRILNLPRPEAGDPDALHSGKGASFPSRHAYSSFFIAVLFLGFYPLCSIPLFFAAVAISLFRVFARVHSPIDVLAGAVIGAASAGITLLFL